MARGGWRSEADLFPGGPLRAGGAAGLDALALLAGCSPSDITGEPEDIETLVQVVASGSHASRMGATRFST